MLGPLGTVHAYHLGCSFNSSSSRYHLSAAMPRVYRVNLQVVTSYIYKTSSFSKVAGKMIAEVAADDSERCSGRSESNYSATNTAA